MLSKGKNFGHHCRVTQEHSSLWILTILWRSSHNGREWLTKSAADESYAALYKLFLPTTRSHQLSLKPHRVKFLHWQQIGRAMFRMNGCNARGDLQTKKYVIPNDREKTSVGVVLESSIIYLVITNGPVFFLDYLQRVWFSLLITSHWIEFFYLIHQKRWKMEKKYRFAIQRNFFQFLLLKRKNGSKYGH